MATVIQNPTGVLAQGGSPFRPAGAAAPAGGPYKRAAGEEFWGLKIALPSKKTVKVERRLSKRSRGPIGPNRHAATLLLGCSSPPPGAAPSAAAALLLLLLLLCCCRCRCCCHLVLLLVLRFLCAEPSPFMMRSLRRKARKSVA